MREALVAKGANFGKGGFSVQQQNNCSFAASTAFT